MRELLAYYLAGSSASGYFTVLANDANVAKSANSVYAIEPNHSSCLLLFAELQGIQVKLNKFSV